MPLYTSLADVSIRLRGKVQFEDTRLSPEKNEGRMPLALATRLIDEAEGQVEQDLSPRYLVPFQSYKTCTYAGLPDRPTKNIIRTLAELQSVIRILETDFGSGTVVDAQKYSKNIEARYRKIIDETILKRPEGCENTKQFSYPPLPYLQLAVFNNQADDGYPGGVLVEHGSSEGSYASNQIDDASEDFTDAWGFDKQGGG
jgi:hypothetical protein